MISSLNDHYTSKGGEQMVAAISNNSLVGFNILTCLNIFYEYKVVRLKIFSEYKLCIIKRLVSRSRFT